MYTLCLSLVHTVYGSRHRRDIRIRVGVQQKTADTIRVGVIGEIIMGEDMNARVKPRVHHHNSPRSDFCRR